MPGTLSYAAPATVLPKMLCTAFASSEAPAVVANGYNDGSFQGRVDGSRPRHSWQTSHLITYAAWIELVAFWRARRGAGEAFYFYPDATQHDASGVSTYGRYIVRFDGQITGTYGSPRWGTALKLIEVA